jgi:hypothetical protein
MQEAVFLDRVPSSPRLCAQAACQGFVLLYAEAGMLTNGTKQETLKTRVWTRSGKWLPRFEEKQTANIMAQKRFNIFVALAVMCERL